MLLVNNKGDINKTLKQLASNETVRKTLTAALTAGALQYVNTSVMPGVFEKLEISDAKNLQGRLVSGAFEGTTSALVDTAINGGSLEDNLKNALLMSEVNAAHGFAATQIKMAVNNDILRIISQSVAGCVAGEIQSGQCGAGAIGSGVGETVAEYLLNGRNPTFVSDLEKERILTIANFASAVTAAYSGYDANIAIQNSTTTVLNNSYKDKAIEKLEAARKFLDEKSQKALDGLVAAYKKGDIELAKKYKSQLDDAIANWASSGNYEVLGVNPKAAVGAAVFAVGELFIPTNIVDVVPVGKLTKAGKVLKLGNNVVGEKIAKIASTFPRYECKACAAAIVQQLQKDGVKGKILDFKTATNQGSYGNIWSDTARKNISTNGEHRAVMVDGIVYDNIHPNGIPYAQWKNDFHSIGDYKITETNF